MLRWDGGNTAEETASHSLAFSQVSDKTKLFTQLKWRANLKTPQNEELQNKRAALPRWHLNNRYTQRDEELQVESGGPEGVNAPQSKCERVSEELSQARKFKLKVQGSECSQHVSTAISTSAVCVHKLISRATSAIASSFTDKQQQAVVDRGQTTENCTEKGNKALASLLSWLRKGQLDV